MEARLIKLTDIENGDGELTREALYRGESGEFNRVYIPLGASLPRHTSSVSAWLQVISGSVRVEMDTAAWTVNPGEMLYMPAGQAHWLTPLANSVVLVAKFRDA